MCFIQDKLDAISCLHDTCFTRQIFNITNNTLTNCGIPESHSIDSDQDYMKVRINMETRLCVNGTQYFEFL